MSEEFSQFLQDAYTFVTTFQVPIATSTPHIYLSALPFENSDSLVAGQFTSLFSNTLGVTTVAQQEGSSPMRINVGTPAHETIHIWDTSTQAVIREEEHQQKMTVLQQDK
jgi:hypothetical protein